MTCKVALTHSRLGLPCLAEAKRKRSCLQWRIERRRDARRRLFLLRFDFIHEGVGSYLKPWGKGEGGSSTVSRASQRAVDQAGKLDRAPPARSALPFSRLPSFYYFQNNLSSITHNGPYKYTTES